MESRTRLFGHSVHQSLVALPVGLLAGSVVFDTMALLGAGTGMSIAAYWMQAGGILTGLLAAPFGLKDLLSVPVGSRARRIGRWHGVGNLIVLWLFIASWALRPGETAPVPALPYLLSLTGLVLLLMTGWLGGELVSRLGVGVAQNAHANARSSLKESEFGARSTEPAVWGDRRGHDAV